MGERRDFFISYVGVNGGWAEWIAVELEHAGYSTVLQAWDFTPGTDFMHQMQEAVRTAARTIAVLSPTYLDSRFSEAEWRSVFVQDPTGELGLLLPVRIQRCDSLGLLASRVYVDLVDVDEAEARRRLLRAADPGPRPNSAPFPGSDAGARSVPPRPPARFPGLGPELCNLPARNPYFSGRDETLAELSTKLQARKADPGLTTAAVHGLGGVGKTQLVLEYAYRFASDYDLVWWIPAEQPTSAVAAIAALANRLSISEAVDQEEMTAGVFEVLRSRDRWLLVYDDAERPDRLTGLLPTGGAGHVLVTSRWSAWAAQASPLGLGVLAREESVALLQNRVGADNAGAVAELAELLGDLPLALDEAAAYLDETKDSIANYLELVRDRSRELFGLADPAEVDGDERDRRRVASVWSVSLDRVRAEAPGADDALSLLAFLAPDVPRTLLAEQSHTLPGTLARTVADHLAYNRILAIVGRYSLVTLTATTVSMHRLVQAVIQARIGPDAERTHVETAVGLIRAGFPAHVSDVRTWPECARLLPQLLAVADHARRLAVAGDDLAWLLDRASAYLRERGQYRQASPLAEWAVKIAENTLGRSHPEVAWRHDELGRVRQDLGDLGGAREHYEYALRIGQDAFGPDHANVGIWRNNLGNVLHDQGDLEAARQEYERALRIGEAELGPDHPDIGIRRNNLATVLHDLHDLSGAREQYERALAISEAALGPDHPTVGIRRGNLGAVLLDMNDIPGALEQLTRALEISEATLGSDHPTVAIRRSNLGQALRRHGDSWGAMAQFERALQTSEAALGPDHPNIGIWHNNLGNALQDLGELDRAKEHYQQALRIGQAALGPHHPTVVTIRNNLGTVLQGLGDLIGARDLLEQTVRLSWPVPDPSTHRSASDPDTNQGPVHEPGIGRVP